MSVFIHHVGDEGATEDFPKTVMRPDGTLVRRSFDELRGHMPELSLPAQQHFAQDALSSGQRLFQIWGIPSGGERMLSRLQKDDVFLLLPTQRMGSRINYAGRVLARAPSKSFALSKFLWGNERFPIIFLMDGEQIDYSWEGLWKDVGFKPNYQLRGNAIRISDDRLFASPYQSEAGLLRAIGFGARDASSIGDSGGGELQADLNDLLGDNSLKPTVKEALIQARLGQGPFRSAVLKRWDNKCAVTGCPTLAALRASHIKPWRHSSSEERLDPTNGIALIANLDAVFDRYLVTFDEHGGLRWSSLIKPTERHMLSANSVGVRKAFDSQQQRFLIHHRETFASEESRRVR